MLKRLALAVFGVIVGACAVVATRPAAVHIERTGTLKASPDVAFALINDLRRWDAWSPWAKRDPAMSKEFSGANAGVGAHYAWSGNDDVGAGKMTIVESTEPSLVKLDLKFTAPFAATNVTTFRIAPSDAGSTVTWAMDGHNTFMAKAVSLVMDMDEMVGGDFEQGLGNLQRVAEVQAAADAEQHKAAAEAAAKAEREAQQAAVDATDEPE